MDAKSLRTLRLSLHLTQAEMAIKLGIERVQYSRIENGHKSLSKASAMLAGQLRQQSGDEQ